MRKTYLKPEITNVMVTMESLIASSFTTGGPTQEQGPGSADSRGSRNDWESIWN